MANTLRICKECGFKPIRCKGLCKTCYSRFINRKIHRAKRTNADIKNEISITGLQKGWTQLAGSKRGYEVRNESHPWNCQACGSEQPAQLTPYLFPFMEMELLRICSPCQNLVHTLKIKEYKTLRKLVRA